jgi:GNAT superfamily N-acetyltransferase
MASPGRRGRGHASAILAELERRLAARGCRKSTLDNERVTGFYRQRGYTQDQLIFMEKWLPPATSGQPATPAGAN